MVRAGEPLKFAIVGAGVIGRTHAEAVSSLADAELIAVVDEDPARARALSEQYGAAPYDDVQTMLAHEPVDVVNICTPSGLHGEQACRVMRAGRHVIVEKPMEIRPEALDEMQHTQQATGVKLAVISQHRFDPASVQVHDLIAAGRFGRLVLGSAQIAWWRSQRYYDSGGWRGTWALDGGGVLMNQGIHTIDLLQWMMGPVHSVKSYTGTLAHRIETEDTAVAVLHFENGALGTIGGTTAAYPGVATRLEVYGDRGSAVIVNDRMAYLHVAGEDREEAGDYGLPPEAGAQLAEMGSQASQNPATVPTNTHAAQIADMIDAIRQGREPLVNGEEGRRPVDLILAIYESARTGREVVLQ